MNCGLVREYLNLVDENGENKGIVMPCDLFRHLTTTRGMDPPKAAILAGVLSVIGGLATNPSFPLYAKTDGPEREMVQIPRDLDPIEVLKQGGKGLFNQVIAIAEALLIPHLSQGLERKMPGAQLRDGRVVAGRKKRKGILKMLDMFVQNKDLLNGILRPILKRAMKGS